MRAPFSRKILLLLIQFTCGFFRFQRYSISLPPRSQITLFRWKKYEYRRCCESDFVSSVWQSILVSALLWRFMPAHSLQIWSTLKGTSTAKWKQNPINCSILIPFPLHSHFLLHPYIIDSFISATLNINTALRFLSLSTLLTRPGLTCRLGNWISGITVFMCREFMLFFLVCEMNEAIWDRSERGRIAKGHLSDKAMNLD